MDDTCMPIHFEENKNLSMMEIISMRNSILTNLPPLSEEEKRDMEQWQKECVETLDTRLSPIEKKCFLHTDSNRI